MSNSVERSSSLARSTSVPILIRSGEPDEKFAKRQADSRVSWLDASRRCVFVHSTCEPDGDAIDEVVSHARGRLRLLREPVFRRLVAFSCAVYVGYQLVRRCVFVFRYVRSAR